MRSFIVTLFLELDLTTGDAAAQWNELNAVGLIDFQDSKDQERQSDRNYLNGQHRRSNAHNGPNP